MVNFPSDYSSEELVERWDEFTSPSRFAGNDETMDLVFVAKRKGNKVKLVRKARSAHEPFSCVFRGEIKASEKGSRIVGVFTKSWLDYAAVGAVLTLLLYIRHLVLESGDGINTINALLVIAIVGSLIMLMNYRRTKRRYADFLVRITGKDTALFRSRNERKESEEGDQE